MPNNIFTIKLGELAEVPGSPYAYWAPRSLRELFKKYPPLDRDVAGQKDKPKIADVKVGLTTGDDLRFTRFYWEVDISNIAAEKEEAVQKEWAVFLKACKPFYYDASNVVYWLENGKEIKDFSHSVIRNEQFYFSEGLSWIMNPQTGGKPKERLDVQLLPKGVITSVSVSMIFPSVRLFRLLGFLNSKICGVFPKMMGLDKDISVGYLSKIPIAEPSERLELLAKEAYWLSREWDTGNETSTQFIMPWILQVWRGFNRNWRPVTGHPLARDFEWSDFESTKEIRGEGRKWSGEVSLIALANECVEREKKLRKRIEEIQKAIDEEVYRIYGISEEDRKLIEEELSGVGIEETESEETESEVEEEEQYDVMPPEEHIKRLLSYYALEVIKEDRDGIVPANDMFIGGRKEAGVATRVIEKLINEFEGEFDRIENEIAQIIGRIEDWFVSEFFTYHTTLYRLRPIIWQLSSEKFRQGRKSAFSCFIYWHKLDADTIPKVRQLYLRPFLESAKLEVDNLRTKLSEGKEKRRIEREFDEALRRYDELKAFDKALEKLLKPHQLKVTSRSKWVKEKVNEIIQNGYKPERDYGVRVNIEPLKQAGVLSRAAERVKG